MRRKKNPVKRNGKCRKVLILNVRDQNRVFCENNLTGSKETLMTSRNRLSSFTILKKLRCKDNLYFGGIVHGILDIWSFLAPMFDMHN